MSAETITIAIVEDNDGLRRSLETIVKRGPGTQCVGLFAKAEDALRELPTLRPNVVLMDINLPGMDGVECVTRLAREAPGLQIVMLTVYDNTDAIFNSLAAGASGYLLKPVRAAQLLAAIKEVHAGGAPMTPNIARRVVQAFKKPAPVADETASLSPREHEVLDLLAKGFLQKEIADQLGISYWTVQTHIARIYEKLHVRSRAQAVAKYFGK
jgi:DNA-binding NarL/FixJ family response regulator